MDDIFNKPLCELIDRRTFLKMGGAAGLSAMLAALAIKPSLAETIITDTSIKSDAIDYTPIGAVSPSTGAFTTLKASTDPVDEHGVGDRGFNDTRYLSDIVEDTTPQLGGNLDAQSNIIQGDVENNLNAFEFGAQVLGLMTDPRLLNVMCEDPSAGTLVDISGKGHDGTYQGTWTASDRLKQGKAWVLDPNGTDAYIDFGDSDDFSFGDGTNDSPFTVFGLIEVVDVSTQMIITKRDDTSGAEVREWHVLLDGDEKLRIAIWDNSANVSCVRFSNAALSVGWHTFVVTYDGVEGATAANGIKIYVDGIEVASTTTNHGSYVAMENLTTPVWIGANRAVGGNPGSFMTGDIGLMGIDAVEWSAADAWRLWQMVLAKYSENGVDLS